MKTNTKSNLKLLFKRLFDAAIADMYENDLNFYKNIEENPSIKDLIKENLFADDSIREAEVLLREGMSMRAVMNRLYYAMFYAVLALLQEKELGTSKHAGAISLFDKRERRYDFKIS